jgi:glycosyltransferase involved in cell wall biosynthesis
MYVGRASALVVSEDDDLELLCEAPQEDTSGSLVGVLAVAEPRISVVMPALNEAKNLPVVFGALPAGLHEVILVDGNSADDTIETAIQLRPDVRVIRQTRRGKGNALACGFAAATGHIIVALDADGSTDPAEIPRFVDALLHDVDFAKGSRFIGEGGSTDITRLRSWGNQLLNRMVNRVHGTHYTDLCYGYNAFWRHCLPAFNLEWEQGTDGDGEPRPMWWGDGFEVETLINIRVAHAGLRVVEVPSFERARIHGRSNLNAVSDGLRVLRTVVTERWSRRSSRKTSR